MRSFTRNRERPLERLRNRVPARAASQPMAGQARTSDLATKAVGAWLAIASMSSQET